MKRWLVSISVMLFGRDQVDVGQEQLDRDRLERLVHRQVDLRIGHDLAEVVADLLADPRGNGDES